MPLLQGFYLIEFLLSLSHSARLRLFFLRSQLNSRFQEMKPLKRHLRHKKLWVLLAVQLLLLLWCRSQLSMALRTSNKYFLRKIDGKETTMRTGKNDSLESLGCQEEVWVVQRGPWHSIRRKKERRKNWRQKKTSWSWSQTSERRGKKPGDDFSFWFISLHSKCVSWDGFSFEFPRPLKSYKKERCFNVIKDSNPENHDHERKTLKTHKIRIKVEKPFSHIVSWCLEFNLKFHLMHKCDDLIIEMEDTSKGCLDFYNLFSAILKAIFLTYAEQFVCQAPAGTSATDIEEVLRHNNTLFPTLQFD